jgi:hypothetical protein
VPEEITEDDKQRMPSFEGETSGWVYVNYKAYHAGITLFDGKATKVGENTWQSSTNDMLKIENDEFEPKISEKNDNSDQVMNGSALEEIFSYKVIFSGKFTETEYENVLITSFIKSGLNSETSQNIKLLQIGEMTNNSEKLIVSYQDFRNSILIS